MEGHYPVFSLLLIATFISFVCILEIGVGLFFEMVDGVSDKLRRVWARMILITSYIYALSIFLIALYMLVEFIIKHAT